VTHPTNLKIVIKNQYILSDSHPNQYLIKISQ